MTEDQVTYEARDEARPSPSRPEDRDYLRSVVEQIHRDTHDALEAVPARPEDRGALDELVERWLRYSKEAQGKPDSDYDRGRAFAYWIAADSLTAVLAAVQPPPRDPAGEGEHPGVTGSEGVARAAVNPGFCPSCLKPEGYCVCVVNTAARPSSPTGETPETAEMTAFLDEPCSVCGRTWRQDNPGGNKRSSRYARRHWHEIKHGHPFTPTGETPCATCGLGADPDCPCGANEGRHAEHECDTGDAHPYVPTGETAGQGVEEARRRVEMFIPADADAQDALDAYEEAIRAEALAEYAEGHDMHCENEARATAAEAERDQLRADKTALTEVLTLLVGPDGWLNDECHISAFTGTCLAHGVTDNGCVVEQARRALAGESTGAGEGE